MAASRLGPGTVCALPRTGAGLRWRLAGDATDVALFADDNVAAHRAGAGEYRGMEFLEVNAGRVINAVPGTSRMPFRFTINAYRGCSHACVYCFARPTHEYLGLDLGEDFERKIVVKVNAVERARAELRSPRWHGDHIAMGTNTDPYQKAEGRYRLTRRIVEELAEHRNPFSILTKSTLVLRDLDVLAAAAARTQVRLNLSVGTLDRDVWRLTEPGTPPPDKRIDAVRRLNEAGVPCGVLVAPVLPGLSDGDDQVRAVVEAGAEAGAVSVSVVALHLRSGVREHYFDWLGRTRPDLVDLHRRRFRRGAYQDAGEQGRLAAVVEEALVWRHRTGAAPGATGRDPVVVDEFDIDATAPGVPSHRSGSDRRGMTAAAPRQADGATPAQLPLF